MITPIGNRVPRLFFVDEGEEPYYFKEELILPDGYFKKPDFPEDGDADGYEHNKDTILYCARMSVKIAPHRPMSGRIIATSRLAELLGIEDMVAKARAAELIYNGERLKGTKIPPIGGANFTQLKMLPDLKGYRPRYTPEAVRQLTILTVFDYVCGQIDRHSKNIKLFLDIDLDNIKPAAPGADGFKITGVCAIDHDLSFGELRFSNIKKRVSAGLCICPVLMGEMQYPAVDMDFCGRLFSVDRKTFEEALGDLLSEAEIDCCFDRIEGLKYAIDLEEKREKSLRAKGADFFPRLIREPRQYNEYLRLMEENAGRKNPDADFRFSRRPTYLKLDILRQLPLPGGDMQTEQAAWQAWNGIE